MALLRGCLRVQVRPRSRRGRALSQRFLISAKPEGLLGGRTWTWAPLHVSYEAATGSRDRPVPFLNIQDPSNHCATRVFSLHHDDTGDHRTTPTDVSAGHKNRVRQESLGKE